MDGDVTTLSRAREFVRLPAIRGRTRLVTLPLGAIIGGGGISLTLWAGLGLGPYDLLIDGVSEVLGTTFGVASVVTSVVVVFTGWRLGGPVGPGTIVTMLGIGPMVDAWGWLLPASPEVLWLQVVGLLVGLVTLGFGLSLVVASNLGGAPVEVLMLGLAGRGLSLPWVRTLMEITMAATGWALGGMLGLGTVVIALAIGHILALFLPKELRPDQRSEPAAAQGDGSATQRGDGSAM